MCCSLAKSCSCTLGLGIIWLSLLAACRLGLGERSTAISDLAHHQILASNLFDRPGVCLAGSSCGRKGSPTTRLRAPAVATRLESVNAVEELWLTTRMTSRLEALKVGVGQ
jgi:hypothetical protein